MLLNKSGSGAQMKALATDPRRLSSTPHAGFLVEEFSLERPRRTRCESRSMSEEGAAASAGLAMNQGIYNGLLASGLAWSLLAGPKGRSVQIFCLIIALIAGVFGASLLTHSTGCSSCPSSPCFARLGASGAARQSP